MGLLPFVKDRVTLAFFDKDDVPVGTLECEVTLSATHSRHAQVSRHPVAKGEATTDNVRPDPKALTLDCFWGNKPADIVVFGKRYATGEFSAAEEAYEKLNDVFNQGWRITIPMRLWTYENMVIEDMSVPQTVDDGASVKITIQFTEIKTVKSKSVPQKKAEPTKKGEVKKTAVKPKVDAPPAKAQTAAAKIADDSGASANFTLFKKPN